jgi:flagellin FlaB
VTQWSRSRARYHYRYFRKQRTDDVRVPVRDVQPVINTAGFLQSKSAETGQQSGQQVTNRLEVSNAVGTEINSDAGELYLFNITVKKAPGADNIDLENVTARWVGPSGTYNLVNSSVSSSGADGNFGVRAFKDADNSKPVLNDPDDRMVMVFDNGADNASIDNGNSNSFGQPLSERSSVELRLTTKSGATATARLVVPESLFGKTAVNL